ncbi:MAG: TIGR00270 family protein [Candidatus Micrarchaeota archaeon]|nr:TIGR00270 family protein [Candidatus Micrarchaeota archaeon]
MECELCGRQTEERYIANIENVELRVCARCAKGRHVTEEVIPRNRAQETRPVTIVAADDEIAEDYGSRIRRAREHMKIPVRVLAEMISEKEGVVTRVEQQKMVPPEALRKKLEKALGIRLGETATMENQSYHGSGKSEEATLGEFVN